MTEEKIRPHEICVIDDRIPTTDEDRLERMDRIRLKAKLDEDWGSEQELRKLVERLVDDNKTWQVSAYSHPNFYRRDSKSTTYRPDIVVFDWNYSSNYEPVSVLLEILESSFALVWIYSGSDNVAEIEKSIEALEFTDFRKRKRLHVLAKGDDSHKELVQMAETAYSESFSFRFGRDIRFAAMSAVDATLVALGRHSDDFVKDMIAEEEDTSTQVQTILAERLTQVLRTDGELASSLVDGFGIDAACVSNLVDLLGARIREHILGNDLAILESVPNEWEPGSAVELWRSRLYFSPTDEVIRTGDIVVCSEKNGHYVVLTPDCHLRQLREKCCGNILLVRLFDMGSEMDAIGSLLASRDKGTPKKQLKKLKKEGTAAFVGSKLAGLPEAAFFVPFVPANNGTDFLGFAYALSSSVLAPIVKGEPQIKHASYLEWPGFERVCTTSEPFASALAQWCLDKVGGIGVPNYPKPVQNEIKKHIEIKFQKLKRNIKLV